MFSYSVFKILNLRRQLSVIVGSMKVHDSLRRYLVLNTFGEQILLLGVQFVLLTLKGVVQIGDWDLGFGENADLFISCSFSHYFLLNLLTYI